MHFAFSILTLLLPALTAAIALPPPWLLVQRPEDDVSKVRVPLTLGVMSRCPDAFLMESVLDKAFQTDHVKRKIDLEMVYLGSFNSTDLTSSELALNAGPMTDTHLAVICKHGEPECKANKQQLCTQQHTELDQWWSFLMCQDFSSDRIGTEGLARECAKVAGFAWEGVVEECANGKEGERLLRDSVTRAFELGIEKSATLLLGEEQRVRCIHDGSWKSCDDGHAASDFVKSILDEYERLN